LLTEAVNIRPTNTLLLVRANARALLAMDTVDAKKSLGYALDSVNDATFAQEVLQNNAYAVAQLVWSHTVAAIRYRELNDTAGYQQHVEKAEKLLPQLDTFPRQFDALFVRYNFLQQIGQDQEAVAFLCGLDQSSLNNYLRTFRMFAWFRDGNIRQAKIDFDGLEEDDRQRKESCLWLVELGASPGPQEREELLRRIKEYINERMASGDLLVFGPTDWAVLRLLQDEPSAERIAAFLLGRSQRYKIPALVTMPPYTTSCCDR